MPIPDDDLMQMYRDGDASAFDLIFDRHVGTVFNFAWRMLGNGASADEVTQDVFLSVARAAGSYTARGRFRPWLLRIARNRCLNRIAADRARREVAGDSVIRILPASAGEDRPHQRVVADETEERLQAALLELPAGQREAIVLYAIEGLSYAEVAETMEVPLGTVKTNIFRARARLAELMRGKEG